MTMLVAEFHNGESIARLVRSALRREIAAVTLTARPRSNGLHQLQLRLQGAHCVTLAAEPVGRDDSGRYKLLLAPLDPSDESELRAVVREHGGTDPSPPPLKRSEPPPQTRPLDSKIFDLSPPLPSAPAEEVSKPHGADANDPSISRAIIMDAGALGLSPDEDQDDDDALTVPGRQSMVPSAPIGPDGAFPPPPISPTMAAARAQTSPDIDISISVSLMTAPIDSTKPSRHSELSSAETHAAAARMGIDVDKKSSHPPAAPRPETAKARRERPTTKRIDPIPDGARAKDRRATGDAENIEVVDVSSIDVDFDHAGDEAEDDTINVVPSNNMGVPSTAPSRVNPGAPSTGAVPTPMRDSPRRSSAKFDPRRTLRDPIGGRSLAGGKYTVHGLIGAGAIGAVYRGVQPDLERSIAVKVLHPGSKPDPAVLARFRKEALTASQVDHRNITRIHDLGQEPDGLVYIVMELLTGRSLQQILDDETRIKPERAIRLMMQVAAALSAAHERAIVHRDVKPDNVMLVAARDDDGDDIELVKVCDFGIATLAGLAPEEDGYGAGTPDYMAPEQARGGQVDARADIYACGVMLFELVTGRAPFEGESAEAVLAKHAAEPPPRPSAIAPDLPIGYDAIVLRALAKSPADRFQTARELRTALKRLLR